MPAAGGAFHSSLPYSVTATLPEQQNATATACSTARPRDLCRACAGQKSHPREADLCSEAPPLPALAAHLGLRRRMLRRSRASHPRPTRHHGAASTRRGARGARLRGPRPILLWLTNAVALCAQAKPAVCSEDVITTLSSGRLTWCSACGTSRMAVASGAANRVGGGLTPPVPPHHRTYGSVSGGSPQFCSCRYLAVADVSPSSSNHFRHMASQA